MTDQEFDNCKQALLMAAKMICDQDVSAFWAEAWRRRHENRADKQAYQLAQISDRCLDMKLMIDGFNQPPQP